MTLVGYGIFLGDVAKDEYYKMEHLPELGEKIPVEALPSQLGGMIANAASVYKGYGGDVRFLSFLSPSDAELCAQLETLDIDTSLVQFDETLAPSKCLINLTRDEHTVLIVDMKRHPVNLPASVQAALCKADFIYTNYWELQWLRHEKATAADLVRQWHENGVRLFCDLDVDNLNDPDYRAFIPYTTVMFMNKIGYERLCTGKTKSEAVDELLSAGLKALVVTLAGDGCRVFQQDQTVEIPAVQVPVVDVTGAGDTFCSSFVWWYQRSGNMEQAAQFATYAAARSITIMGARAGSAGICAVLEFMKKTGCTYKELMSSMNRIAITTM